jgi:hypothetical protein
MIRTERVRGRGKRERKSGDGQERLFRRSKNRILHCYDNVISSLYLPLAYQPFIEKTRNT